MWCMKSQFFDSRYAYGAKRSSNGRRDLPKLSSKCIPKHPKSTTKMHRSAIYTHRERENRWFHRCRKSNENVNYKIACFSLPCVRIGLQWSPAPSKKCWKFIKKQQKFFKNRVGSTARLSGRVVGQSYARFKAEIELQNIRTTPEHDSQPPNVHFEVLCPAAATPAPSRPVPHSDWTKIFSCAVSTLASKCLATYAGVKNCFSQHSRRVTRRLAARLKAELALDNIPKASGMHTLQFLTRKCDPKIVSYLKQGAS